MTTWQFICHVLGVDSSGPGTWSWSAFWGGSGSDISLFIAFFAGLGAWVRKYNCERHGCWRLGRHATAAGHVVCRHHHPDGAPDSEAIASAHRRALRDRAPAPRRHV